MRSENDSEESRPRLSRFQERMLLLVVGSMFTLLTTMIAGTWTKNDAARTLGPYQTEDYNFQIAKLRQEVNDLKRDLAVTENQRDNALARLNVYETRTPTR